LKCKTLKNLIPCAPTSVAKLCFLVFPRSQSSTSSEIVAFYEATNGAGFSSSLSSDPITIDYTPPPDTSTQNPLLPRRPIPRLYSGSAPARFVSRHWAPPRACVEGASTDIYIPHLFGPGTPVLVPGFQWSGWSNFMVKFG
jgi:hypothetical protein